MNILRNSMRKPEGQKQLRRPRLRWDDIIKINPKEISVGTNGGSL